MSEILYKDKNAVVIYKSVGIPSQPDPSGDADAMTLLRESLRAAGESDELYLVHRLDRVAEGLLIYARNKRAAAELSRLAAEQGLGKEYLAVVSGEAEGGILTDYLYKDARQSKAFVVDRPRAGAKLAELEYECIGKRDGKSLLRIELHTGRFHQIRVQMASRKMPLVGDGKYGSRDKGCYHPALVSHRLELDLFGKHINVIRLPDTSVYPYNVFAEEIAGLSEERK